MEYIAYIYIYLYVRVYYFSFLGAGENGPILWLNYVCSTFTAQLTFFTSPLWNAFSCVSIEERTIRFFFSPLSHPFWVSFYEQLCLPESVASLLEVTHWQRLLLCYYIWLLSDCQHRHWLNWISMKDEIPYSGFRPNAPCKNNRILSLSEIDSWT